MADETPRLDLNTYKQGDTDWDHTDTVEALDEHAIARGPIEERPAEGDYDDELYYATDQRILWGWDADTGDWTARGGLGSENDPVPGTTYRDAVSTAELNDVVWVREGDDPQERLDEPPEDGTVVFDGSHTFVVGDLEITTDGLTVVEPNLKRQDDYLDDEELPVLTVTGDDVTLVRPRIDGNRQGQGSPDSYKWSSDIEIHSAERVTVQGARLQNSARHGILVVGNPGPVRDTTIIDTVVDSPLRYGVSLEGRGTHQDSTVITTRAYESVGRSTLEVNDGVEGAHVINTYGEGHLAESDGGVAAVVTVDDHGGPDQGNRDIVIDGVWGREVDELVFTGTTEVADHHNITFRNVSGPITSTNQIRHISDLTIENWTFEEPETGGQPMALWVHSCDGVEIDGVAFEDPRMGELMRIDNCNDVIVTNVSLPEGVPNAPNDMEGIRYRVTEDDDFSDIQFHHNRLREVPGRSIFFQDFSSSGSLDYIMATNNYGDITDTVGVAEKVIDDNLD